MGTPQCVLSQKPQEIQKSTHIDVKSATHMAIINENKMIYISQQKSEAFGLPRVNNNLSEKSGRFHTVII